MAQHFKSISLLTVVILLGTVLAACGSNNDLPSNGNTASKGDNAGANTGTTGDGTGDDGKPVELNMFVDATWYPFQDCDRRNPCSDHKSEDLA